MAQIKKVFSSRPLLFWIIILSVLLRVGAAIILGEQVVDPPGTADQISYHNLAIRVLGGYGFSFDKFWWPVTAANAPTAHWSFLYTFYLVFIYGLFGIQPLAARIIQAILVGILHPALVYWIGRKCFNERIGLVGAGISGVYTYFIYYAGNLMTEPFYIVAILGVFAISISIAKHEDTVPNKPDLLKYCLFGILLGCTVLLRQLFLLFIPFLGVWILWARGKNKILATFARLCLSAGIMLAMILPFTYYNYVRFNRFVLLNTNSGYAFFFGNHPIYGTHFVPILTEEMGTYEQLIPPELLGMDEAALDQELLKRGLGFVFADPGRYILLSISRIPAYFQFWPSTESGIISNLARVASFGIFLPFMLYGLVRAGVEGRLRKFTNPESILIIFLIAYSVIHLLSWALIRYRLPVDSVALIFAALALNDLYERYIKNRVRVKIVPGTT